MKIYFHPEFYKSYNDDLLSEPGRMECVIDAISPYFEIDSDFKSATEEELLLGHAQEHIDLIKKRGLYDISALATGAAIQAARTSIREPAFAVARPGGHHAMINKAWGFCFFSSMAIAVLCLHQIVQNKKIFILDFDHHFGNGTDEILKGKSWVQIFDLPPFERDEYLERMQNGLKDAVADVFAISAGFDHHKEDFGRLETEDYYEIGKWLREAVVRNDARYFGILEGGYNHKSLSASILAFLLGLEEKEYK